MDGPWQLGSWDKDPRGYGVRANEVSKAVKWIDGRIETAIWEHKLDPDMFRGYNPFCAVNILHDRLFLEYDKTDMTIYLIEAFGGDPENITIAGQSAGGGSVLSQMALPDNAGFFRKAIIISAMIRSPYGVGGIGAREKLADAEKNGETAEWPFIHDCKAIMDE